MPDLDNAEELDTDNNTLGISDEEFENLSLEDLDAAIESGDATDETGDENDERDGDDESGGESGSGTDDGTGDESGDDDGTGGQQPFDDGGSGAADESGDGDDSGDAGSESDTGSDEGGEGPFTADESGEGEHVSPSSGVNYKAEYEKLLSPFKANGKEMQVDNVDDARTLMQMGANYNKKMAALKPNLKLMKMLDNNDLLNEDKISFLIDLSKNDPQAIKKLIKDSEVDPDDLDLDTDHSYKQSDTYTVNDNEIALDDVLEDIQDNPSFNKTMDIISNKWDEPSKKVLATNPNIIKIIDGHVAAGAFDDIWKVVERDRALGKLQGMSDLEAYRAIGDQINEAGGFDKYKDNSAGRQQPDTTNQASNKSNQQKPNTKKTVDPKLRERKKAAGSTRATSGGAGDEGLDPLSMPDDEFEKIAGSKYM